MRNIGLVGNPNSGKTTLFNRLTGLRQKTGNYPGVTTEVHRGTVQVNGAVTQIMDLPGAYSLYPNTSDELELVRLILEENQSLKPDIILYVADIKELDKQLLLLTQLMDLGMPCALVLTMADKMKPAQAEALQSELKKFFGIEVFLDTVKPHDGHKILLRWIEDLVRSPHIPKEPFYQISTREVKVLKALHGDDKANTNMYRRLLHFHHAGKIHSLRNDIPDHLLSQRINLQITETLARYSSLQVLEQSMERIFRRPSVSRSDKVDQVVTHPVWGPLIFLIMLMFIFQAIYAWAAAPMDWIDGGIVNLGLGLRNIIGPNIVGDFLVDGVLAGLGGILVFVPQIAILFFLIGIMEESGYMARAVYMFDHLMRRFGMSGRSMVSLMSAGACAIPAVMSARSIENNRERLITILVTPFISCSARIPVYTILIGLAVPSMTVLGMFNLKGLVFTSLYIVSVLTALISGFLLKKIFRQHSHSSLVIEIPHYQFPRPKDVLVNMWIKTKSFVVEAGKIILLISIVLWFMGSYGPGDAMKEAAIEAQEEAEMQGMDEETKAAHISSGELEASFAGKLGRWLEPVIEPLGYDWKIGIALIASFAAREVFVGTMATIYSMQDRDNSRKLQDRLAEEINPETGQLVFNFATSISLLVFFLFAMQCMSTLAIVKKETGSWKWPLLQLLMMTSLAYLAAFAVYQLLS